jgi:thiol-disulfide isomerase/thioredoxin
MIDPLRDGSSHPADPKGYARNGAVAAIVNRWPLWLAALFFAAAAALAWALWRGASVREFPPLPSVDAGAVTRLLGATLPDSAGRMQPLAQWRGRILVVNYWATWCPPCRDEMPMLSRLQQRYAARGVQFVGIALDDADRVRQFARETPLAYPLLVADDSFAETSLALGNARMGLPYTVVVDREGRLLAAALGRLHEDALTRLLDGATG